MNRLHSVSSRNGTDSERQTIAASHAVKPLPPLPRGWSRVSHEIGLFLRGIGLGIVVTAFQGIFTKNFSEPEKVAIRRSRTTALLRTLIHAVPVGVAIFEIVFNFKGHFVGNNFDKQNYLQFVAKAHEIAMQASIATILLSYIRYHISVGNGMPFGAVLSGLQFLQVSYLWSVELWSSVLSKEFRLREKICFAVLILVCITVAATAGPSSANLLIARQGLWSTSSTYLAVNASFQEIWPDRLDDEKIEKDCAMINLGAGDNTLRCPISDLYKPLQIGLSAYFISEEYMEKEAYLESVGFDFARVYLTGTCMLSEEQFCGSVPQTQLLDGFYSIELQNIEIDLQIIFYQFLRRNYYQPYTIASCVADIVKDASDQTPLRFARISETKSELEKDREIFSIPGLTKNQIIDSVSGDSSGFRVDWIDLPMDVFNTGIPGAIIVHPRDPNGSSYNITTCTLNAGWGSSEVMGSSESSTMIYSRTTNIPPSWPDEKLLGLDISGYQTSGVPQFANYSGFSFPQRRISASKNWMEYLNPTVVLPDNSTERFIPVALSSSKRPQFFESIQPTEANLAQMLNLLLATALGANGIGYDWEVFNDYKNSTTTCDTCLVFEVESSMLGWFYSARGTSTRLALTVMLAYCTLVLGHIVYSAISGVSSTAWDSAAELVLLAMNSSPTEIAQNTCAGILGRKALKTTVQVLATTPGHLELVFGESKSPNAQVSKLVLNEKYGKIMGKNDDEAEEPGSTLCPMSREIGREELLFEARSKEKLE